MQILDTVYNANIAHTSSGTEVLNLSKKLFCPFKQYIIQTQSTLIYDVKLLKEPLL